MELQNDWSLDAIAQRRDQYFSPGLKKFVPFADPISFRRGQGQYLWDSEGNKYTDLLGMNVCISVGHAHPDVVAAASAQAQELPHCTTMFYHPVPAHFAEELAARNKRNIAIAIGLAAFMAFVFITMITRSAS